MARSIARRIRSGTLVGPGTKRKLRPGIESSSTRGEKQSEKLTQRPPHRKPHGWVGAHRLRGGVVTSYATDVAAGTGRRALSEICEQRAPAARPRSHVASHRRRGVAPRAVGPVPHQHALGAAPVATGAPRFLIIALQRAGRPPM